MKYRVVFMERTDVQGRKTENPPDFVELDLSDGIVLDRVIVERSNPTAVHSEEVMGEDDDFLSVGTEVWEYDVAEGREEEFVNALRNSQMVIEFEEVDDEMVRRGGKGG